MRCRKVRSFLSAYCSGDLTGRKELAIRDHLSTCSLCRKEEALFRSISAAGKEFSGLSVSEDFNTKLLNRIGQERFKETRTKAYFPRRVPVVGWWQVVPALSVVAVLALVAIYWTSPGGGVGPLEMAHSQDAVDDLYLTVQPTDNPNLTSPMHKDWSLGRQLQLSDRMARISNTITDRSGFGNFHLTSGLGSDALDTRRPIPYTSFYYRVQPIIRVYQSPKKTGAQEDEGLF